MKTTIGLIFDFDDTLVPDSTTSFLDKLGVDVEPFWQETNTELLGSGWDPIPAYLYKLIEFSKSDHEGAPITREKLKAHGKSLKFHKGVTRMFTVLKTYAAELHKDIELEFYVISSGIGEIIRASRIYKDLKDMWACDYHYADDGSIVFPKNVISYTEKTRYLYQISKGIIGPEYRNKHLEVNKRLRGVNYRIPFKRMIFVGDGATDIPCFALIRKYGGITYAVYPPTQETKWGRALSFSKDDRVLSFFKSDYSSNSDLMNALRMAIRDIADSEGILDI